MVHEPHRHFGDSGRPLLDLNAVEEIHPQLGEREDVELLLHPFACVAMKRPKHLDFKQTQFAVGDDEEISATAGGVEEFKSAQLFMKLPEHVLAVANLLELRAESVHEKRIDDLLNVSLRRVVTARLPALLGIHDALEERTKDGG